MCPLNPCEPCVSATAVADSTVEPQVPQSTTHEAATSSASPPAPASASVSSPARGASSSSSSHYLGAMQAVQHSPHSFGPVSTPLSSRRILDQVAGHFTAPRSPSAVASSTLSPATLSALYAHELRDVANLQRRDRHALALSSQSPERQPRIQGYLGTLAYGNSGNYNSAFGGGAFPRFVKHPHTPQVRW